MPIARLLANCAFDPEATRIVTAAFEAALRDIGLSDEREPIAELLAQKIIEVALTGERDPFRIYQIAIDSLSATIPSQPGWPAARDDDSQVAH